MILHFHLCWSVRRVIQADIEFDQGIIEIDS